jgi:hypothetical protein
VANDLLVDGYVRVTWALSIANIAAPTQAELNAGTALEQEYITPKGLKISPKTGTVDTSALGSTFNTGSAGRREFDIELECKRKFGVTDVAWNLFAFRSTGFLVVRRNKLATGSWATSDQVEVYPVMTMEPEQAAPEENAVARFTVGMLVTSDPQTRAVVA